MTSYLGLPLDEAVTVLEKKGIKVVTNCVTSKKGASGNENRVIRSRQLVDGSVELVYSQFCTVPENSRE